MAAKKAKHRKFYRVLVIPDDKDEPTAFDLSVKGVTFLKVLAIVLGLHVIGGAVFYIKFFNLQEKNAKLVQVNKKLEGNMTKINELMAEFQVLESDQNKIRNVLGLGTLNGNRASTEVYIPEENTTVDYLPDYSRDNKRYKTEESQVDRYNFLLKSSKSSLHDYARSIPTLLPVDGMLSADFEYETAEGPSQHRGIDIAGNKGDMVKASADGVVIFAGWTYDLGNLMIIYHGNGYYTYYGHNERCLLPRGSFVKKGEYIAILGNTGISSAPHLHFEIWKDGVPYNPKDFILAFSDI